MKKKYAIYRFGARVGFVTYLLLATAWVVSTVYSIAYASATGVPGLQLQDGTFLVWIRAVTGFNYLTPGINFARTPGWIAGDAWALPQVFSSARAAGAVIPLWAPIVVIIVVTLVLWLLGRRRPAGRCVACHYDLTGNTSGVCPECGASLDSDAQLLNERRAGPPRLPSSLAVAALSLWFLVAISNPAQWHHRLVAATVLAFGPLCLVLLVDYVVRVARSQKQRRLGRPAWPRRLVVRWLVLPSCLFLLITSVAYPWPMMVRFRLSRPAFDAAAADCAAGKFTGPIWIGLYHVEEVIAIDFVEWPDMYEFLTEPRWRDFMGFEYDPTADQALAQDRIRVATKWNAFYEPE